jgi:DNA-binding NtrC family response regulator
MKRRIVVLREAHLLGHRDQAWVAREVADGRILLSATSQPGAEIRSELRSLLDATTFELPRLADRAEDIDHWATFFLAQAGQSAKARLLFSPAAVSALRLHQWPGNLTELASRIARAVALSGTHIIEPQHLGLQERASGAIKPLAAAVDEFKYGYIMEALRRCSGNRTRAAAALEIDVRTVFRMLERTSK